MSDRIKAEGDLSGARTLLRLITDKFPLPVGQHHGLAVSDSDPDGLILYIIMGTQWQSVKLDSDDLQKDPKLLAEEIVNIVCGCSAP